MLGGLAENHPDPRVRAAAVRSLLLSQTLLTGRVALVEALTPHEPGAWLRERVLQRMGLEYAAGGTYEPNRTIYDAQNKQTVKGREVRAEGSRPVADDTVNEAYDGLGDTFDLYADVFERDSIDGQGLAMDGVVHFGRDYDNAQWDGRRMIFGDGDGVVFNRFTIAVDVIGHELTHGVTQNEANLIYWGQSGALNESVSDVFGSLVKQYKLNQTSDQADWLIGEGLLMPGINGTALRSMSNPGSAYDDPQLGGKDPQPKDMSGYVRTLEDNGGVHTNSGIPNRAFYEVATRIGGYAWEGAGQIWYDTLTSPTLPRQANFQTFANLTAQSARQLFGEASAEHQAVTDGWAAVQITARAPSARAWAA